MSTGGDSRAVGATYEENGRVFIVVAVSPVRVVNPATSTGE